MTKTSKATKVIRPATTNGKISAFSMVASLVKSGVPAAKIALMAQLSDAERAQIEAMA